VTEYCEASDVRNRLKASGYSSVVDDDLDDVVSASELAANITSAIAEAGSVMDEYFVNRVTAYDTAVLRAGNTWCKYCCVDIAAWYAASNGGRDVPESLQNAYDSRIARLEKIEAGNIIPGTTIDSPVTDGQVAPFEILSAGTS
jgi:phage gp36-like protein